jgi:holo-[acyl-carrier protein] synthase
MIGIDIIKISRMQKMMDRFGEKALKKFLHVEEISLIKSAKTAAGFWATKEAFSKAIGTGIGAQCSFYDIKIYKTPQGAPKIALSKKVIEAFSIEDVALSITHDGEYAISVVEVKSTTTNKVKQF